MDDAPLPELTPVDHDPFNGVDPWAGGSLPPSRAQLKTNAPETKHELVHVLPLTPSLRNTALSRGFPLFQTGLPIASGYQMTPVEDNPFTPRRAAGGRVKAYVHPTPIGPVRGSPDPKAVRTEAAQTGRPEVDAVLDSPVTRRVINDPVVDRSHTIPYTAGGSVPLDDPTMYIDRRFPRTVTVPSLSDPKGKKITFDPARPFVVHENVEQHVMDLLIKGGMKDAEAYRVAHFEYAEVAEGAWYRHHDIDQAAAEKLYAPIMAKIQKSPAYKVPANLYKRPYPHDHPSAARHEAIAEARPSKAEIAQAKRIVLAAMRKEPERKAA